MSSGFTDIGENIVYRPTKNLRMVGLAAAAALLALLIVHAGSQASRAAAARPVALQPPQSTLPVPPLLDESPAPKAQKKARRIRTKRRATETPREEKAQSKTAAPRGKRGVLDGAVAAFKGSVPPPPPPPRRAKAKRRANGAQPTGAVPRIVSAKAIRKKTGEMPALRITRNALGGRESAVVSARICLDRRGRVASASLRGEVAKRIKKSLGNAIRRWRYGAFRIEGAAQPVCFFRRFRLVAP